MRFALGTIPFGTSVPEKEAFAILDRFVEAGGKILDTANNYPFWVEGCTGDESELAIGAWMAARGNREQLTLSTKAGARPVEAGAVSTVEVGGTPAEGLAAPVIRRAAEGSLRRLRTDHIDVYWAHIEDRVIPLDETLGAFHELVDNGLVAQVGASNIATWQLERARNLARSRDLTPYTHLQLRHTYLRPRPGARPPESAHVIVHDETLDYVKQENDLTLWGYNSLLSGAYTRPDRPVPDIYHHPGTTARLAVLQEVAGETGATVHQVVLAWLMEQGIVPIVGVTTMAQLEEAIGAEKVELGAELRARLDAPA
ncbi:aldo/keto reductase [Sinosporangium siamense]|nr:aldo/keto reductase [Sinosporangium siamense]